MQIGGRSAKTVLGALSKPQHYHALKKMFEIYPDPAHMLWRYLTKRGDYPFVAEVQTPAGIKRVTLYSHHDLLTLNEIFCREDYRASSTIRCVVDFGSNIGLSALYFLTRNEQSVVFLYEPVPENVAKLKETLRGYESRYYLDAVCVGLTNGIVEFGIEKTGRYGGIGVQTGSQVQFPSREVNKIFSKIFGDKRFGTIDVLKLDIEGMDGAVLQAIEEPFLKQIRVIYSEMIGTNIPLPGFFQKQRGLISKWVRK